MLAQKFACSSDISPSATMENNVNIFSFNSDCVHRSNNASAITNKPMPAFSAWQTGSNHQPKNKARIEKQGCFVRQRRAIFHFSSGEMAPHPQFKQGYFSTLLSPKSRKNMIQYIVMFCHICFFLCTWIFSSSRSSLLWFFSSSFLFFSILFFICT